MSYSMKFYNNLDIKQNQIQNFTFHKSAEAPSNPKSGQSYYNTEVNKLFLWDGTKWVNLTSSESYTYEQGAASDTWIINHNLHKFPSVSVTDSAGNEVTCSVYYDSIDTCTLRMNGEFKGKAYLN